MPEDKSKIDELNKSLYSRNAPDVRTHRRLRFTDSVTDLKSEWERPKEEAIKPVLNRAYEDHSMSFFTKLLVGSAAFFVIAVGVGAYIFWNGANLISADNIDIEIAGPVSIPGGTPVAFDITVTNNNNIDLQLVDLAVGFPAGATDPKNPGQELATYRELLGDIKAGDSVKKTVEAIIFGEENFQKQIIADVTYQVKGSSSSFTKERTYDVLINSSPVTMSVDMFKEVTSGQEFDIKVSIKSNSAETLKNVLLAASYPFGFSFTSSSLASLPDKATWRLGDIPAGAERVVTIKGRLIGEDTDNRVFRFVAGAQSNRNPSAIGTEYLSLQQEVVIQKPFITVGMTIDGSGGTLPAAGEFNHPSRIELSWSNNLPSVVSDAEISVKLSGSAYDRTLVQPGSGYYRSSTDEIIWNRQTEPKLASVGAGDSGSVFFSVTPRDAGGTSRPLINPTLSFTVTVSGRRTQETGVPENLSSVASREVRVKTSSSLSGRVMRTIGPFTNIGPVPPRADQKTTYTIAWAIDNTSNTLRDAKVVATLPPYVEWLGALSPSTEDVSFSSSTNSISWNVGTVGTHTARSGERRELYFQVAMQPSVIQVNNIPTLLGDATMVARDEFTSQEVTSVQGFVTTRFSTDPAYKEGDESVVR